MFWNILGYISAAFILVVGSYLILTGKLKRPTRPDRAKDKKDETTDK
jgi:hypothetical protein